MGCDEERLSGGLYPVVSLPSSFVSIYLGNRRGKRTCRSCRTRVSALKVDELDGALRAPIQHVVRLDVAVNEVKLLVQDAECLKLIVNVAMQSLAYSE